MLLHGHLNSDFHSPSQIPISVHRLGTRLQIVYTMGVSRLLVYNVAMAEKMTAGEYEDYLYSVL